MFFFLILFIFYTWKAPVVVLVCVVFRPFEFAFFFRMDQLLIRRYRSFFFFFFWNSFSQNFVRLFFIRYLTSATEIIARLQHLASKYIHHHHHHTTSDAYIRFVGSLSGQIGPPSRSLSGANLLGLCVFLVSFFLFWLKQKKKKKKKTSGFRPCPTFQLFWSAGRRCRLFNLFARMK